MRASVSTSTVNISFRKDLLDQIDCVANEESRTRGELIREAARLYLERKKRWAEIFEFGSRHAAKFGLTEDDITDEIMKYRSKKRNPLD